MISDWVVGGNNSRDESQKKVMVLENLSAVVGVAGITVFGDFGKIALTSTDEC